MALTARKWTRGMGQIDLVITLAVSLVTVSVGLPVYDDFTQRAKLAEAIGDIGSISMAVEQFRLQNEDRVPTELAELGIAIPLDPWGEPYEYVNVHAASDGAELRKDDNLKPLNRDFDLYSRGRDRESTALLSAAASHDDIVRAADGTYIGIGADY